MAAIDRDLSRRWPQGVSQGSLWGYQVHHFLSKVYGEKLTVKRGKVHDYLGCDYDFSTPQQVKVSMIKYSRKTLADFPEAIDRSAPLPAADHLFTVRDDDDPKKRY